MLQAFQLLSNKIFFMLVFHGFLKVEAPLSLCIWKQLCKCLCIFNTFIKSISIRSITILERDSHCHIYIKWLLLYQKVILESL